MTEIKKMSRKDFMKTATKSVAGVAVMGTLGGALTGCSSNEANASEAAPYPYEYKKLDPDVARERAYNAYFDKGGWGVGVAEGFFGALGDEYGYPFNQVPPEAFTLASSGYQQGELCGCLGVAAVAIGMVTDQDTSKKIVRQLFDWYKDAEFPMYQPEGLNLKTTVAESALCNDSVGKYMEEEGVAYGDHERKARCAGVTADVVGKTVEILNETLL